VRDRRGGRGAASSSPGTASSAGFFEHDVRFGSSVTIEVQREATPARDEAVRLVWPAFEQETARAVGEGDWRPSLSSLKVVELLGG
jgi:hypothetical protein